MKHYQLQRPDRVLGASDLFVLSKTDLTTTVVNGGTLVLDALAAGDIVSCPVLVEIVTAITGPTGTPTVAIEGGSTGLTTAKSIMAVGYQSTAETQTYYTSGGDNLEAVFAAGGGDGAAATAGEIWIWVGISRKSDRRAITA
jgi:hypothetical protein